MVSSACSLVGMKPRPTGDLGSRRHSPSLRQLMKQAVKCSQLSKWTVELFKQSLPQLWPRQTNDAQKYPHAQLGNVSIWAAIPNMQLSYLHRALDPWRFINFNTSYRLLSAGLPQHLEMFLGVLNSLNWSEMYFPRSQSGHTMSYVRGLLELLDLLFPWGYIAARQKHFIGLCLWCPCIATISIWVGILSTVIFNRVA